jgi:uncharacterized LabA/DUF88 family protein
MKLRIFIDFWNFQLSITEVAGKDYRVDWKKISPWILDQVKRIIDPTLTFEETRVYLSFDPRKPDDKRLRDWANNTLDHFPGIRVSIVERKPKNPPTCPNCHKEIEPCPHCHSTMAGTIEKGVDTAIVTDLLSLAWENAWDVAVLTSSDRDFIPAVELLSRKGYRVINAHFPPMGMELARVCWASIDLRSAIPDIAR